ncbi:XAC2610-related protein [Galbibacter pacificus]|uniref:Lipoprotein n=1 Tax=Galbibacter pacificus TaxID=2996052 RepID=A0ABT6FW06_9FLAO|nr:hypothetical protein [Galbibacter pacificus]MDG3584140.1 hypothetical protein [Galbibacter pacificus]MDG3587427.1 hypothetical protein [Galbibacter pacificus]
MKKYLLILGFIAAISACKNDDANSKNALSKADSLKLRQNAIKKISDEDLIKKLLRSKNNQLTTEDTVFYKAMIKRPKDSAFIAMNLYGKTKRNGRLQEFKQTAIIKDQETITSRIQGSVFRIDKLKSNQYKIYTHEPEIGDFSAYDVNFNATPVSIKKTTRTANFYFDLLPQKRFEYSIKNPDKFFNIRKDKIVKGDSLLDTLARGSKIYRGNGLLNLNDAAALNTYYFVNDSTIIEKLIIKDTSRIITNITLSGVQTQKKAKKYYSSAFKNDSVYRQIETSLELSKNSRHVVAYTTDSIVKTYRYTKDFRFNIQTIDSFKLEKTYPQYYPELIDSTFLVQSKPFLINGLMAAWQYSVRYTRKTNANPTNVEVSISNRELINTKDTTFVFEAPLSPIKKAINIGNVSEQDFDPGDFDINFDGYTDLSFPEGYDLNRNATYDVYLYDPLKKSFIKNLAFTGPSMAPHILIDKDHKAAIYTAQTGNNNYSVRIVTIGENGTIKMKETYWSNNTNGTYTIHYQKTQNNAVVEKKENVAKNQQWSQNNFKNEFLNWVKDQIGKG